MSMPGVHNGSLRRYSPEEEHRSFVLATARDIRDEIFWQAGQAREIIGEKLDCLYYTTVRSEMVSILKNPRVVSTLKSIPIRWVDDSCCFFSWGIFVNPQNFVGRWFIQFELHICFNWIGSKTGLKLSPLINSFQKSREASPFFSVRNISMGRRGVGHFLHFLCQQQGRCGVLGHFSLDWRLVRYVGPKKRKPSGFSHLNNGTIQEISCKRIHYQLMDVKNNHIFSSKNTSTHWR